MCPAKSFAGHSFCWRGPREPLREGRSESIFRIWLLLARRLAWFHPIAQPSSPEPRPFNEIEELAFLEEFFELAHAAAAELLIVKIYGVRGPVALAVQDVEPAGFRFPRPNKNSKTDDGNSIQRTISACSAASKSEVIAASRSASAPTSRIVVTIIRLNITLSFPP